MQPVARLLNVSGIIAVCVLQPTVSTATERGEIAAAYARRATAIATDKTELVGASLAPSFVLKSDRGKILSARQFIDLLSVESDAIRGAAIPRFTIKRINRSGRDRIVYGIDDVRFVRGDGPHRHHAHLQMIFREKWIRDGRRWVSREFDIVSTSLIGDGVRVIRRKVSGAP